MTGIGSHTAPNKGATDSWITPRLIIDALGPFDLDPCECTPQPWSCARQSFTVSDNGLTSTWAGRVWLNPPYSEAGKWLKRLADHGRGTALIFARTETADFREYVWKRASALLFLWGRLHFYHPNGSKAKGNSGGPSVLVAYGRSDAEILKTCGLSGAFVSSRLTGESQ